MRNKIPLKQMNLKVIAKWYLQKFYYTSMHLCYPTLNDCVQIKYILEQYNLGLIYNSLQSFKYMPVIILKVLNYTQTYIIGSYLFSLVRITPSTQKCSILQCTNVMLVYFPVLSRPCLFIRSINSVKFPLVLLSTNYDTKQSGNNFDQFKCTFVNYNITFNQFIVRSVLTKTRLQIIQYFIAQITRNVSCIQTLNLKLLYFLAFVCMCFKRHQKRFSSTINITLSCLNFIKSRVVSLVTNYVDIIQCMVNSSASDNSQYFKKELHITGKYNIIR